LFKTEEQNDKKSCWKSIGRKIKMKVYKNTNWWWRSNFLQIREEK